MADTKLEMKQIVFSQDQEQKEKQFINGTLWNPLTEQKAGQSQ